MRISIIVPMLNEIDVLSDLLTHLQPYLEGGCEVLIVDGGSDDGSAELARRGGFAVLASPRGRARQMSAGAQAARGDILLFLHADTRLPSDAKEVVLGALSNERRAWGRFDVRIAGGPNLLRAVSFLMNWRSRLTGIATGDQAIFVHRSLFEASGGFPDQPLMEDIELSRRLKRIARPICLRARVTTSGRRWQTRGVWHTIFLMWKLRLAYWLGARPEDLARLYR